MESSATAGRWQDLIATAWKNRGPLRQDSSTDCFRIFHGYEEGSKGTVIEKFNGAAVIDYKTDIRAELPELAQALLQVFPFTTIIARGHQALGLSLRERTQTLHGAESTVVCTEHGRKFVVSMDATHNPGLYLDARDTRKWLIDNSANRRVLNLFAFTGSLGLSALHGKAIEVIHLDRSKALLRRIEDNYSVNGLSFESRNFLRGDIYKHLPKAVKAGKKFDGIVLDPPPKVYQSPHARHKTNGQDFPSLIKLCTQLLNDNGWIVAMLHHFDCTWDDFEHQVIEASGQNLQTHARLSSGVDFPESNPDKRLRVSVFCVVTKPIIRPTV